MLDPERTVKFQNIATATSLMQTIHILGDDHDLRRTSSGPLAQNPMTDVRLRFCDDLPSPLIKLTDRLRRLKKGLRRRPLLRPAASPESSISPKGRNSTFCTHPRTGKNRDPATGSKQPAGFQHTF